MTNELSENINKMSREEIGNALEKLSKNGSTKEPMDIDATEKSIELAGKYLESAVDREFYEFPKDKTITDYQLIFAKKEREMTDEIKRLKEKEANK